MNRRVMFFPAFDGTDPNPSKNYGVGCLELRFLVEGDKGVVELQLLTNWYLKHVMESRREAMKRDVWCGKEDFLLEHWINPFIADLCNFSLDKMHEDCAYFKEGVHYIFDGKPCYYDYKYIDEDYNKPAKDVAYWKLVEKGDEALWKYLEEYYVEVFGNV